MGSKKRIPVYILSGFLGSGKTTVLRNMLKYYRQFDMKPGIILNEIGQQNVESHLFEDEKVYELLEGCICCTIQDELIETMDELMDEMQKNSLDVLLIEGTGMANPIEIQEVLMRRPYIDQYELISIITVVDASHYLDYQSIFSSSMEVRKLLTEQLICGSLLLLNKTDLISARKLEKVKQKIIDITDTEKTIVECTHGEIDPKILLEKRIQSISFENSHLNAKHHHHTSVQAVKLESLPICSKKEFEKWFKQLPSNILRGKGFVKIEDTNQLYSFQYASGKITFTPVPASLIRKPIMVLIGIGIDQQQLLDHCNKFGILLD